MEKNQLKSQELSPGNKKGHVNKHFLILLGLVMGLRELSMTMLNPFISTFGKQLTYSTPFLAGVALGIYGLTNGFFQIPYGILSDTKGRKKFMLLGLFQLFAGLLIAGLTSNIYVFIFARALQGSGAIMGIAYSWVGDKSPIGKSNQAMGFVGMIVAPSAVIAFVLGPMFYQWISLKWMFLGAACLVGLAILLVLFFTHEMPNASDMPDHPWKLFARVLRNRNLLLISYLGIAYNFIMASLFFILPEKFSTYMSIGHLWLVFAPALAIGMFTMMLGTHAADSGHFKQVALVSLLLLGSGFVVLLWQSLPAVFLSATCVLTGYMCMTTILPSYINNLFPPENRGAANGILQTFTFLGFFFGPTISGTCIQSGHPDLIYGCVIILTLVGFTSMPFISSLITD